MVDYDTWLNKQLVFSMMGHTQALAIDQVALLPERSQELV